ncbi:hypothetical protein ACH5RR_010116 [Cinchona calisaya]|uniref:PWI domain-containing protein n=1 Tax=Cinchona calisaya TaxID=153742 RepID=A0ABD3AHI8_9GENT
MSGGFFRGTSAAQDTRFSNKQAKLLKSRKFAPELEHLVDMTKVKMDVMRPWIATRVTELIGFEDEVLINFIYGLLDGKEVNGKELQISLTGFMERNTGKFMKELWLLLLSAQNNASGVPQQFLDAMEEETKKKKAESDRIANEIRRKKEMENQEMELDRTKKMDRGNDIFKDVDTGSQPGSKYQPRAKSVEEKESEDRNGLKGRIRVSKSPRSADHSSSPRGRRSRSISKSFSNSRSYSDERHRSRSLSASPKRRRRSSSSEMINRYSPRRFLAPHRRHSPRPFSPRRRSSYSRRRSLSGSHSPSPTRYRMRSPSRRRSRFPLQRRSRSPIWRRPRSPTQHSHQDRSQSPIQHRSSSGRHRSPSPIRRKSPSPMRRKYRQSPSAPQHRSRSPIQHRSRSPIRLRSRSPLRRRSGSPLRRRSRSPLQRRSRSPLRRRSPSPLRRRSPSPLRRRPPPIRRVSPSPIRRRSPIAGRRRSPVPANHKSPSPQVSSSPLPYCRSPSPIGKKYPRRERRSPLQSPRGRIRSSEKYSPVRHSAPRNTLEYPSDAHQRSKSSELSSQSNSWERNDSHREVKRSSTSPHREKILRSDSPNSPRKTTENKHHDDSSEMSADDKDSNDVREAAKREHNSSTKISSSNQRKGSHVEGQSKDDFSPVQTHSQHDRIELNKKDKMLWRANKSEKIEHQKKPGQQGSQMIADAFYSEKGRESPVKETHKAVEKNESHSTDIKINDRHLETVPKLSRKVEQNDRSASVGSDSEEKEKRRTKVKDKRKKKRAERQGLDSPDESSCDSYADERKEAKRRRKEEKRLKKEERRRRRREERRHRKEKRHAEKQKLKLIDMVSSPSDSGGDLDGGSDDDQHVQKKLEIELRERALESLKAKKGIGH